MGNIVGLEGLVWPVRSRFHRYCLCRLTFVFDIGVGVLAGDLLGQCCLSIFDDLAGSFDQLCIFHGGGGGCALFWNSILVG